MKSIFLLVLIAISQKGETKEVWINADPSSQQEFEAFIISESSRALSFSNWMLQQQQEAIDSRHSLQSFALLQADYLSKPLEELTVIFENYIKSLLLGPIGESERKQIHYAMLRRAQLSKSASDSTAWILKAIQFAPDLELEADLFPVPLVEHFQTLKNHTPLEQVHLPSLFPAARYWVWNGRMIDVNKTTRVSYVKGAQIVLKIFSDSKEAISWEGEVEKLRPAIQQMSKNLVQGECGRYQVDSDLANKFEFKIFESKTCKNMIAHLKPLNRSLDLPTSSNLSLPNIEENWIEGRKNPSLFRSKWFWIGTGVVAAALVIHKQNQSSSSEPEVQSSTTYGVNY